MSCIKRKGGLIKQSAALNFFLVIKSLLSGLNRVMKTGFYVWQLLKKNNFKANLSTYKLLRMRINIFNLIFFVLYLIYIYLFQILKWVRK